MKSWKDDSRARLAQRVQCTVYLVRMQSFIRTVSTFELSPKQLNFAQRTSFKSYNIPVFAHVGFYDHYAAYKHGYVHLTQPNTPRASPSRTPCSGWRVPIAPVLPRRYSNMWRLGIAHTHTFHDASQKKWGNTTASSGKEHFKPADVEGLGQPARNIDPSDDSKAIGILLYKIEEKVSYGDERLKDREM
jgi:hypothetical protein